MTENRLYQVAYNAARRRLENANDDEAFVLQWAITSAKEALDSHVTDIAVKAAEDAMRTYEKPAQVNPLTTCVLCGGLAVSFAYQGAWCSACESCHQAWRCRTDSEVAIPKTSLTLQREIEQRLDGYMWLTSIYDAP